MASGSHLQLDPIWSGRETWSFNCGLFCPPIRPQALVWPVSRMTIAKMKRMHCLEVWSLLPCQCSSGRNFEWSSFWLKLTDLFVGGCSLYLKSVPIAHLPRVKASAAHPTRTCGLCRQSVYNMWDKACNTRACDSISRSAACSALGLKIIQCFLSSWVTSGALWQIMINFMHARLRWRSHANCVAFCVFVCGRECGWKWRGCSFKLVLNCYSKLGRIIYASYCFIQHVFPLRLFQALVLAFTNTYSASGTPILKQGLSYPQL